MVIIESRIPDVEFINYTDIFYVQFTSYSALIVILLLVMSEHYYRLCKNSFRVIKLNKCHHLFLYSNGRVVPLSI